MSAAVAVDKRQQGAEVKANGHAKPDLVIGEMPSLETIRANPQNRWARGMSDEEVEQVAADAQLIDPQNVQALLEFGAKTNAQSVKITERNVELKRKVNFAPIEETLTNMNQVMTEFNIGEMKQGKFGQFLDKVLPGRITERVKRKLEEHKDASERVAEYTKALLEEKTYLSARLVECQKYRGDAEEIVRQHAKEIAQLKVTLEAFEEAVERFKQENADKLDDPLIAEKLEQFDHSKGLLQSSITDKEKTRQGTLATLKDLHNMERTCAVYIHKVQAQADAMQQFFNDTVAILTHVEQQKGAGKGIRASQQSIDKWVDMRGQAAGEVVQDAVEILKTGVASIDALLKMQRQVDANSLALVKGLKEAFASLSKESVELIDGEVASTQRRIKAANSTPEEIGQMLTELAQVDAPRGAGRGR